MIDTAHAVTPSDSRESKPHVHVGLVGAAASRERSMRALDLALRIADHEVQRILRGCDGALVDNVRWIDTRFYRDDDHANQVERAMRYIGLRHADAFPWRFIRHPERPELVRFEDLS